MEAEKTHTERKKNLLHQLESIVKTLYPNHRTTNPYEQYLETYYSELNIEDVLLFKRLLRSITLLNHKERTQDNRRYISSYGDVLTAIELISRYTINDITLRSYVQLKEIFRDNSFTKLQAARVLRKSFGSVDRYIKLWTHLKLIEKTNIKQGSKHTYRLLGYQLPEMEQEGIFKSDYNPKEYIDLENRTGY